MHLPKLRAGCPIPRGRALTGLRKRGYAFTLERQEGKPSIYRISVGQDRAAA
jgi:hypothetical protein